MSESRIVDRIRRCSHRESISVIANGLERVICEDRGDVTLRYESLIAGDVSRSQFARRADSLSKAHEVGCSQGRSSADGYREPSGARHPGASGCNGARMGP